MNTPSDVRKQVLGPDDVRRAITRMAHEIIERNRGTAGVALVGIQTGGVWVAEALAAEISRIEAAEEWRRRFDCHRLG